MTEESEPEGEWVTVEEMADELGVSVRTARRYADKLPESERSTVRSLSGSVVRQVRTVRAESIRRIKTSLLSETRSAHPSGQAESKRAERDRTVETDRTGVKTEEPSERLVESLRSEVEFLREELVRRDVQLTERGVAEGELRRLMLLEKQDNQSLRARLEAGTTLSGDLATSQPVSEASSSETDKQPGAMSKLWQFLKRK